MVFVITKDGLICSYAADLSDMDVINQINTEIHLDNHGQGQFGSGNSRCQGKGNSCSADICLDPAGCQPNYQLNLLCHL